MTVMLLMLCSFLFALPAHSATGQTAIPFTINLTEPVIVTGTPRVAIDVGGVTRYANFTSQPTPSSMAFTYQMLAGDVDLDGITLISPIDLNGGTITDLAGNHSTGTFPVPNSSQVKVNYPSLGMDFITDSDGRFTVNGTVYNDVTSFLSATGGGFTRATPATTYAENADGSLTSFSANTPRITNKGLLVEGSSTNLLTRSSEFENGVWVKTNTTITPNIVTAPDGGLTADLISPSTNPAIYQSYGATAGVKTFTFSIWIKSATGSSFSVPYYFNGSGTAPNPQTGLWAVTTSWQRFSSSFTSSVSGGTMNTNLGNYASGWSSGNSIHVWGAQLEQGSFPTSYIPTTTASVTRSADVFYVGTTATPQGTFFAEYMPYTTPSTHTVMAYTNSSGAYSSGHGQLLRVNGSGSTSMGGNCCGANGGGSFSAGTIGRVAGSYNTVGNRAAVSGAGGAVNVITNNDFTGIGTARLHLGALNTFGNQQSYGYIRKAKIYPVQVPDTQLRLMSQ